MFVGDIPAQNGKQGRLVNRCEELADVALEHPERFRVILTCLIGTPSKHVHRSVRSFPFSARIRVRDKGAVEKGVEFAIKRVVEKPIAHARFVDIARLRVIDFEVFIPSMLVGARDKIGVEFRNILYKIVLKRLHIFLLLLATGKFLPCIEQIFGRNDIVVGMRNADSAHSLESTPPHGFARKIGAGGVEIERSVSRVANGAPPRQQSTSANHRRTH